MKHNSMSHRRRQEVWVGIGTAILIAFLFPSATVTAPVTLPPVPSPRAIQASFRVAPGLRVELVACEPQITSPVALAFDEKGRLWVVEMRDYPNGPPAGQPPEGRIRILDDRDGDGFYETSSVFADRLLFANGLLPWNGGVIVTAAPHILFLKDSDGDGRADVRDVWYEGFATKNPQLRVSHPKLGLDGWVYVANGLRGGQVRRAGSKAKPINLSGMDFRFNPRNPDQYEAISGMGQFGNTFDDWGRRFVCDNNHHLRHVVFPNRYAKRNPYLVLPAVVEDPTEAERGPLNSGVRIYPLSQNWTTSSLHEGRFTAACGVFIYRGGILPADYTGNAFTCDPTGNLVHREILRPHGASFRSKPARPGVEFLASTNDWFRPVFLGHGPDGALYVVDMCRAVIEHPQFMPPELKNRPDLTHGKDHGRIWRIVPKASKPRRTVQLGGLDTEKLVPMLADANAWRRMTAQRLLWQRSDVGTPALHRLLRESTEPRARVAAAWLLAGRRQLTEGEVVQLLDDDHPRVRQQAAILAERFLVTSPLVRRKLFALANDGDAQVRFQVALTLGELDDAAILEPLAAILEREVEDRWTRFAVASSVPERAGALFATLARRESWRTNLTSDERRRVVHELAILIGSRKDDKEVTQFLATLLGRSPAGETATRLAGLNGLAQGLGRRGTRLGNYLRQLPLSDDVSAAIDRLWQDSAKTAADRKLPPSDRVEAVALLAHADWKLARPVLFDLLADPVQTVRLAAVRALSGRREADIGPRLMRDWRKYTPAIRREVSEAMLRRPERIRILLAELEAGRVKRGDLDPVRIRQLLRYPRVELRRKAQALLANHTSEDRAKVLARYQAALKMSGDPRRGREVFRKRCATCHRVAGIGVEVAPDISDTRTKTAAALLAEILLPNQAIDSNYVNYIVTTTSGQVFTGVIASETATSITLRRAENQTDSILREDIEAIQSTGLSLMPEGLEKDISIADMADLLAFLKNWRYLEADIPGVLPKPGQR